MGRSVFRIGALAVSLGVFGLLLWKASERSEPPPVVPIAPVDAAVAPSPTPSPAAPEPGALIRQLQSQTLGDRKNSFHLGATKSDPHAARMFAEELQRAAKADGGAK